jgi:arachidonate 15-lipoxygenase
LNVDQHHLYNQLNPSLPTRPTLKMGEHYVNTSYKYVYNKNVKSPFLNKLRQEHMPSERWNSKLDQFANNDIYEVLKNAQKNQFWITKQIQLMSKVVKDKIIFYVYRERSRPNNLLDYVRTLVDVDSKDPCPQTASEVVVSTHHLDKDNWAISDEFFCEYRLSGPNPTTIKVCTDDDLGDWVKKGLEDTNGNLHELAKKGELFVVDYSLFAGLTPSKTVLSDAVKHVYGTVAFFQLDGDKLKPVCIHVTSKTNTREQKKTFYHYPSHDQSNYEWRMAKCIFQSNDGVYHEAIAHLAETHLVSEAFMVATYRRLPKDHPLYVLLDKHFEGTAFINETAVTDLVRDGGAVDLLVSPAIGPVREVVAEFVAERLSKDLTFPARMKARGVDKSQLPGLDFPYRDDGMLLWDAILKWTNEYLKAYYREHSDVMQDKYITNWLKELESDEGGKVKWLDTHKFNDSNARSQLASLVASIIFVGSVEHAAVNFPQRNMMQFTAAFPLAMYASDVVVFDDFLTREDYLSLYPPMKEALMQAQVANLLGGIHYTRLGYYDLPGDRLGDYFKEKIGTNYGYPESKSDVKEALKSFHEELEKITNTITDRNKTRTIPYEVMLPATIPQSINI